MTIVGIGVFVGSKTGGWVGNGDSDGIDDVKLTLIGADQIALEPAAVYRPSLKKYNPAPVKNEELLSGRKLTRPVQLPETKESFGIK